MSYHGHICELPFRLRPMGPCPACEYERKVADATEPKTIDLITDSLTRREDAAGERLAQIAARLNAATPGPWEWQGKRLNGGPANAVGVVSHGAAWDVSKPDAEFIAHSRSDMEYLLAALSTAEREREADLRMAWTIGACFGKEFHSGRDDDYRSRSLRMTANECLGLAADGQPRVPSGGEEGR